MIPVFIGRTPAPVQTTHTTTAIAITRHISLVAPSATAAAIGPTNVVFEVEPIYVVTITELPIVELVVA